MYSLNELKSWIFRSSTRYAFMADPRSASHSPEHSAAAAARNKRGRTAWRGALFRRSAKLLRNHLAAAAELGGKVLQLGQAVAHPQHGLGIVDMNGRLECEFGQGCREHVDHLERRVVGHQMATAFLAVFPLAERRLGEGRDIRLALGDAHRLRLPQAEGVHRSARPGAAGTAMAITHRFRRAADLDLYSATEAATGMIHGCSPRPSCSPRLAPGNKHRDALSILPVLVSEHSDQITLLQPDADEDVGRGHCGEQHVADGHDRGGPKRDE